jgi:hypothetical protein
MDSRPPWPEVHAWCRHGNFNEDRESGCGHAFVPNRFVEEGGTLVERDLNHV